MSIIHRRGRIAVWLCVLVALATVPLATRYAPAVYSADGLGLSSEPPPDPPPEPPEPPPDPPPEPPEPPPDPPPEPPQTTEVWMQYGFAVPGHPLYSLIYPDPNKQDMLGLAAKGNIIIGDYTSPLFQDYVRPRLKKGGTDSIVQEYAVDPTDQSLGYVDEVENGEPTFKGNYDRMDGGRQWNGTQWVSGSNRKFYESSLPEATFKALIDPGDALYRTDAGAVIDAVLFTNHALAGAVPALNLDINGTLVARDEALVFNHGLSINHDVRLLTANQGIILPGTLQRLKLRQWKEVP